MTGSQTGREQLFDLNEDPQEMHDLAPDSAAAPTLAEWRARMVDRLRDRPEGFVDGDRLVAGRPHRQMVPGTDPTAA